MEKYLQNIVGCFSGHCKQNKYAYKKTNEKLFEPDLNILSADYADSHRMNTGFIV